MENEPNEPDTWTALKDIEFNARLRNLMALLLMPRRDNDDANNRNEWYDED